MKKWICPICGHIHEGEEFPTEACPICGNPADEYVAEE